MYTQNKAGAVLAPKGELFNIHFVHYTQAGPDWQLASLAIAEKSSDGIFLKRKGSGNAIQSLNRKSYVDNMGLVIVQDNV